MWSTRGSRWSTLAVIGLLVGACETSTEPGAVATFDAEAALADYETIDAVLSSNGWAGFQALGSRTPFAKSADQIDVVAGLSAPRGSDDARSFALHLADRLQAGRLATAPSAAPIISHLHRGKTFVYDPAIDDYAVDPDRTGAPANGVRFIMYAVDVEGRPIVDEEIGYADLVDEGDNSSEDIVLHLTVVERGVTILDYRTSLDENGDRGTITVDGFLSGDGNRLDFAIEATGTDVGGRTTLDVSFDMRVDARNFSITGTVHGVEEGNEGEGDVDITVRHRSESIRVDLSGQDGVIDGTFFLNGDVFATVSGPENEPTFLGASGDPLTGPEFLVLRHIVDTVEDVFDFLEDLVDPVDELVTLGAIL